LIDIHDDAGKLGEEEGSQGGSRESSTAHRHFKSKLEEALTAKQEFEAKMTSMDEKMKLLESENVEMKQKVSNSIPVCSFTCMFTYFCVHLCVI